MKTVATSLFCACLALLVFDAVAQDKKAAPTAKDVTMKPMTMQECKDHMAMSTKASKKDDAMMKKDSMCADMMKKEGSMAKDAAPKK